MAKGDFVLIGLMMGGAREANNLTRGDVRKEMQLEGPYDLGLLTFLLAGSIVLRGYLLT